ncbi:MAG TPA: ATP-binding protein [Puia sp.]|nr:ATP-binding protein [Puia sp.]
MRNPAVSLIRSFYEDIVYSGIREDYSPSKRKNTVRFNQFILLILIAHFVCVISYFFFGLYISALINLTAAYIFIVAYHLGLRQKFLLARIVSVINLNLYLVIMNYMEGVKAGEYLFYFPYFLIMTFIINFRRKYVELMVAYLITLIALLCCYYLCPPENYYQVHIAGMFDKLYESNLVLSLLLSTFFSYAILRINRNNESTILKEKQFVDTIFNTSLDGVFILDAVAMIITDCNQRALELLEIDHKAQIVGAPVDSLFTKEHLGLFGHVGNHLDDPHSNSWQGELALASRKDNAIFAFVSVVSFLDNGRRFWKISVLDISEIKMTQFELMKAKQKAESASRAKSRFLSNMSHELRTPLNGIIGSSNLLLQEKFLPEQRSHLEILKFSSEHMMVLINDILDFNKIESGRFELESLPVNLRAFLQKLEAQFSVQAHARGLLFLLDIDESLEAEFLTDETRLNQIFSNLLSNAIKFTHTGGITLGARKISSTSKRSAIQFMVKDTGIGIPANKQHEVFESFTQADTDTTRKYGGTGLGLAISRKLVGLFGGDLQLQSEEGKGSTFYFTIELEVNENAKLYINDAKVKQLAGFDRLRVLIAEDNSVNMSVVRRFLVKWGIEVHEATNGIEAVEKCRADSYDLVLIDLEMPEMDGATALAEIRKLHPSVPAIAFTAAVYEDMKVDLVKKGFMEVVPKPFRPEDLHSKIQKLVSARA